MPHSPPTMPSTPKLAPMCVSLTWGLLSLLAITVLAADFPSPDSREHTRLQKRALTYKGCYSASAPLQRVNTYQFQSQGYCENACDGTVIGLTMGDTCFCGTEIPADADKVDDSKCDTKCTGWGQSMCGGDGFWTVYTTQSNVPVSSGGSSDKPPSDNQVSSAQPSNTKPPTAGTPTVINPPTVVTSQILGGATVLITVTPTVAPANSSSTSTDDGKEGGSNNTAGIAAGAVVGVVALLGIIAGLYFFIRHRKQKQAEDDYKQRTQVSNFMRGTGESNPPGSGYSITSDSRLDPEAGRRNSLGSLADNQDYSRRILRVANPDSS